MPASQDFCRELAERLAAMREQGLYKEERIITSAQAAEIAVAGGARVVNFCANNYLGLANAPALMAAAKAGLDSHGFGLASVRFICGTQDIHKQLEQELAAFLGMEDAILYSSCFDANGGLFECLLGEEDAVVSDALNHASIIDGIRLCKARRYRYANNDMADLRAQLDKARAEGAKRILIATDGVFSMDGIIADLKGVCDLADEYEALVMVDDSHAVGFVGKQGAGRTSIAELSAAWILLPAPWARPWAELQAVTRPRARKWWTICASARGPTCFPIPWPRPWWPPP